MTWHLMHKMPQLYNRIIHWYQLVNVITMMINVFIIIYVSLSRISTLENTPFSIRTLRHRWAHPQPSRLSTSTPHQAPVAHVVPKSQRRTFHSTPLSPR